VAILLRSWHFVVTTSSFSLAVKEKTTHSHSGNGVVPCSTWSWFRHFLPSITYVPKTLDLICDYGSIANYDDIGWKSDYDLSTCDFLPSSATVTTFLYWKLNLIAIIDASNYCRSVW
jgi:hypothetical protein